MKIGNPIVPTPNGVSASKVASTSSARETPEKDGRTSTTIQSPPLQQLVEAAGAGEAFDAQRVESLRQRIEQGEYTIDLGRLATNIQRTEEA